jgi:RNA ligase (TIGR02306 family)
LGDWNPSIVRIEKVRHHPDADALDVCTVLGDYPVITKRDEYQVNDLAGYIPIDSIVPDTQEYYFLCPKAYEKYEENGEVKQRQLGSKYLVGSVPEKYRIIKAKKIRGIYSQGMLVRVGSWLNDPNDTGPAGGCQMSGIKYPYEVGDSIVEYLGLKKWEEPEEENLPGLKKTRGTNAEKAPQGWSIPHYDIDGARKYIDCLLPNEEIVLTEKIHGSNAAFVYKDDRLWVKSRNFYKKMDPDDMWWDIALRYNLQEKLSFYPGMVFFGEVYGQIKGFRYDTVIEGGSLLTKVRFFDVWNTQTLRYVDYEERIKIITSAQLDPVPELYRGPWTNKDEMYSFAEGLTTLGGKHIREGWVLNTLHERYEPKLDSRMQVKLVGMAYNLQK